jgi:NAD(P)-dependent dehydrogenase (short-subunit alcohol dehydrogenase family)
VLYTSRSNLSPLHYKVISLKLSKDASNAVDNARLVQDTVKELGGLDIIVANAGWTRKTKPGDIYDLSHEEWNKVSKLPTLKSTPRLGTDIWQSAGQRM